MKRLLSWVFLLALAAAASRAQTVPNASYNSGTQTWSVAPQATVSAASVTFGGSVNATFQATGSITLSPGFHAQSSGGAVFRAQVVNSAGGKPPSITSNRRAIGSVGSPFSYQIRAMNAPTSHGATNLPPGLSLNSTGLISGTPTTAGDYSVTLSATNVDGSDYAACSFSVYAVASGPSRPVISSATTASGTVGAAFSYQITATNSPSTYTAAGLPGGLTVNNASGLVSGTPTTAGSFNVSLTAANSAGTATGSCLLTIAGGGASAYTLWAQAYGVDAATGGNANGDPDGDGRTNYEEYLAGTNPLVYQATGSSALPSGWSNTATSNTHLVGFTSGSFAVDQSGAATYSIPIWVSPGTNGMQPSLSLNYNSNGANGYLGTGWSLGGTPVISRRNAVLAADGRVGGIALAASDRFALDGNRLIAVSGTNGGDGAEYRTERESFSRIYSYGTTGYGPEQFVVKTKAGLTMEYGSSTAGDGGRIYAGAPAASAAVVCWALDKITDAAGNYCQYHYSRSPSSGEFYVSSITYGTAGGELSPYAEVSLVYEDRGDKQSGFVGGAPWQRSVRLKTIISKFGGSQVRAYVLTYETSPNTGRSRLISVQEFDGGGSSLPEITVKYQAEQSKWRDNDTSYQPIQAVTRYREASWMRGQTGSGFIDVDGDGLPDQLYRHLDYLGDTEKSVSFNTGSGWDTYRTNSAGKGVFIPPQNLGVDDAVASTGGRFVDLDGDGFLDYITSMEGDGSTTKVWLNRVSGWTPTSQWTPTFVIAGRYAEPDAGVRFADLDGDGRVDVLWARHGSGERGALKNSGTGWVAFPDNFDGTSFSPPSGIRFGDEQTADGPAKLVDLNGDGLVDIVQFPWGGTSVAYLNNGHGWTAAPNYAPGDVTVAYNGEPAGTDFVDVNGDGLVDQVTYRDEYTYTGSGSTGPVRIARTWLNTGAGWQQSSGYELPLPLATFVKNWPGTSPGKTLATAFADVNGDGLVDYIYSNYSKDAPTYWSQHTFLNTGAGWQESENYKLTSFYLGTRNVNYGAQILDVNGDGMVDAIGHWWAVDDGPGGSHYAHAVLNASKRPDLVQEIKSSSGLKTSLAYDYLTNKASDTYTRGERPSASAFPVVDVQNSTYVVRTVTEDDGSGGSYVLTYSYGELRQSQVEGNLGFGWMSVADNRTSVLTTSLYRQDYPYIGLVSAVAATKADGAKLRTAVTTWDAKFNASNSRIAYPYAHVTTEQSYEPATSATTPFLTKTTTVACDATWGDPTSITTEFSDGYKVEETHSPTYVDSASAAYPGQMSEQTVSVKASAVAPNPAENKTRTSKFTYDSVGRLKTEAVEPSDAGSPQQYYKLTTYSRDSYGNVSRIEVAIPDATTRATDFEYAATLKGRLLTKRTVNVGYNHITNYDQYDEGLGALKQKTEKAYHGVGSDLVTTYLIDSLGRVTQESRPDGTTTIGRFWSASGPANTLYAVQTLTDGAAPTLEFFDGLGRSRRSATVLGDRAISQVDTTYNSRGLVDYQSRPYVGTGSFATTTVYDELGRPKGMTTPAGTYTYGYDGFTTTVTAPPVSYKAANPDLNYSRSSSTTTTRTGQGWTTKVVQTGTADSVQATSQIVYTYDPFGALRTTTDSANNVTTITPDLYGRKTQVVDPDRGTWSYQYYSSGELRQQTDARSRVTQFTYDALGRPATRTVDATGTPQVTTWTYDSASGFGRGSLASVSAPDGYGESRNYDALGHPTQVSRTIDGTTYAVDYTYDSYGRLRTTGYPGGLVVRRDYTGFGQLAELRNFVTQALYFRGDEYSPEGHLQHAAYGNGLETERVYRPEDGLIESIQAGRAANPAELQDLRYLYEAGTVGNLYRRTDLRQHLSERFVYDGLTRMTAVWRGPDDSTVGSQTLATAYNAIGNVTSRDGQSYAYTPGRPHAVQTALGNTYSYDGNGNLFKVTGARPADMSWTAFNQPDMLAQGGASSTFRYDADFQRVLQSKGDGSKIVYVGQDWEREVKGGTTTDSFYLFTPLGRTVEVVYVNGAPSLNRYYFTDHLGSVDTVVTDSAVTSPERLSYDAWGVRRLPTWQAGTVTTTIRRGFTDHEMLDGLGLIHMNGRIYDPALGRFLSADPINQDIYNTQTFNSYSYVLNNPLSYTDPTGMEAAGAALTATGPTVVLPTFTVNGGSRSWLPAWSPSLLSSSTFGGGVSLMANTTQKNNSFQTNVVGASGTFGPDSAKAFLNVFAPGTAVTGEDLLEEDGSTVLGYLAQAVFGVPQSKRDYFNRAAVDQNIANASRTYTQINNPGLARDLVTMEFMTGVASFGTGLYAGPLWSMPGQNGYVARVGNAVSADYRATFFRANPSLEGQVIVHHAIEQQVLTRFPTLFSKTEIHSLENLRGIPKSSNPDLHLSQLRREWNAFYRQNANPSRAQFLQKATDVDLKYGSQFRPPVGK